jgi:hypothetical protein
VNRSQREIERELRQLERQEKQLVQEIRKLAAKGVRSSFHKFVICQISNSYPN